MLYFSYGSNMSQIRLRARTPSAKFVAVAYLAGHRLVFHKASKDGSSKCDAKATGNSKDCVIGVVYDIFASEKLKLDQEEGLGSGYNEKNVDVVTAAGNRLPVYLYYATHIDATLAPYRWYKEHVLIGAYKNSLPEEYVQAIEAVAAVDDLNKARDERELAIYR